MRLSALIVLLGTASCTLGVALAVAPTPTPKAHATPTDSADNAPITSLPFDTTSAEKMLAEIKTEDKVFSSLDKQLPQSPQAPKITPIDESPAKAHETPSIKSPPESLKEKTLTLKEQTSGEKRTLNSGLVPRAFDCQTPVDNFYVHASAFRSAMRKVDQDNAALDQIHRRITAIDRQIHEIYYPQGEPLHPDDSRRAIRRFTEQRNECIRHWETTANSKNRHLAEMTSAARMLNADEMALRRKDFVMGCRLPAEVKHMIDEQIDWNYIDSLLRG